MSPDSSSYQHRCEELLGARTDLSAEERPPESSPRHQALCFTWVACLAAGQGAPCDGRPALPRGCGGARTHRKRTRVHTGRGRAQTR